MWTRTFPPKKSVRLTLNQSDFTTAARLVILINGELGGKYASARDSSTIDLIVPFNYENNTVEFMAAIENIAVNVDTKAKVVLNERTGTIIMGEKITITPVAIAHGDLSIEVKNSSSGGSSGGKAKVDHVGELKTGTSVSDLVKALNALGVQPKDLSAIFQSLKSMGSLQAELEVL
jgi:flagellar P-ring protein precursor FlgI